MRQTQLILAPTWGTGKGQQDLGSLGQQTLHLLYQKDSDKSTVRCPILSSLFPF